MLVSAALTSANNPSIIPVNGSCARRPVRCAPREGPQAAASFRRRAPLTRYFPVLPSRSPAAAPRPQRDLSPRPRPVTHPGHESDLFGAAGRACTDGRPGRGGCRSRAAGLPGGRSGRPARLHRQPRHHPGCADTSPAGAGDATGRNAGDRRSNAANRRLVFPAGRPGAPGRHRAGSARLSVVARVEAPQTLAALQPAAWRATVTRTLTVTYSRVPP
jgi:hypothetical protein